MKAEGQGWRSACSKMLTTNTCLKEMQEGEKSMIAHRQAQTFSHLIYAQMLTRVCQGIRLIIPCTCIHRNPWALSTHSTFNCYLHLEVIGYKIILIGTNKKIFKLCLLAALSNFAAFCIYVCKVSCSCVCSWIYRTVSNVAMSVMHSIKLHTSMHRVTVRYRSSAM